jgi:putative tributyrin esterase
MIVIRGGAHLSALGISSSFVLALPEDACEIGIRIPYVLCLHDDAQNGDRLLRILNCEQLVDGRRFALLLPNGQNGCFMNMAHGPKWQTYLLDGLLPFAERSFPLVGKPSLLGIGTGGWAAAHLKTLFSERFSLSSAVSARLSLPEEYAMGRQKAIPDLEAVFGDPMRVEAFPLSPVTQWLSGEGAVLKALELLTDGSVA